MKKRQWLVYLLVVLVLVAISACMMIIGRGHTIYFDNKTTEWEGQSYEEYHKVEVIVDGERAAKLYENERGSSIWLGQNFKMTLVVTDDDGNEKAYNIALKLPYNMDGIVINIPALLNGGSEEAYLSEFIVEVNEDEEVEEINTDEFSIEEFSSEE